MRTIPLLLVALLLVVPISSYGEGAIDTNSLRLRGPRSTGGMLLPSSRLLERGAWDLSLTFGHEGEVVRSMVPTATTRGSDRHREATWLESRDLALLQFAVSPFERLEVQWGIPILLGQQVGSDPELSPLESGSTAFGDLRMGLRFGIWGSEGLTASLQGGLFLPTGAQEFGMGDETARADVAAAVGYQSEAGWAAHLHLGHLMGQRRSLGDQIFGDTFAGGLLLQYRHAVGTQQLSWSLEALASSVVAAELPGTAPRRTAFEILGGARYFLENLYFDAGAGFAPVDDGITPRWRLLASVGVRGLWEPAPAPEPKERVVYVPASSPPPPSPPPPPTPAPAESASVAVEPPPSSPAPDPREAFRALSVEERSIYFQVDSAALDATARLHLRDIAVLVLNDRRGLVITGYADDRGTPERNDELSLRRAEAVRDVLVEAGVEPSRLQVEAAGARKQLGQATEFGRSINRRVTFRWVEGEE